jgi:hypothetical protein
VGAQRLSSIAKWGFIFEPGHCGLPVSSISRRR